ncbi:MAG: GHKL domain-containing protein [Clostridia bacterium]|nr:GHKL domain-containing protein [Clostridia bacterium]
MAIATCTLFLLIALKVDLSYSYKIAIFIISLVFIFACAWIFIYYQTFIGNERKINELRIENERQEIDSKYLNIIEQNNKNLSILAHDIKNHMLQIKSMENADEIHSYVDSIVDEVQGYGYVGISKNKTLDLLISKYLNLCDGRGIKITFDVKTANLNGIAPADISTIINNLLDNAVESAEKSEKKEISVSIFKKQGHEIINIINSCDSKPKAKGDKLLTTKKEDSIHGYGTQSVIKTLKKYEGVYSWEYDEKEKIFETNVLLPME